MDLPCLEWNGPKREVKTVEAKLTQTLRAHRCEMNSGINLNFGYVKAQFIDNKHKNFMAQRPPELRYMAAGSKFEKFALGCTF
jgi:hypothetical protein